MVQCKRCGIELNPDNGGEYCPFCKVDIKYLVKQGKLKKCEWCGEYFAPKHGNEKYCDKHKEEAKKENGRKRRNEYYKRNKKSSILSQLGTTTLSPKPNNDENKEKEIVRKEKKKIGVTTVYKGKYSYSKGKTKFTNHDQPVGQYGIQLTHNYGTLDDYHQTALNYILKQQTRECPDCHTKEVNKDRQHAELQCSNCGLVLMGPYDLRVSYPFMEYPEPLEEHEELDPMSWYPKPELLKREGSFDTISFDKTPIKVICSRCKRADTIPLNKKDEGCPICGGRFMGAGICMPQDFSDEFAPPRTENSIKYDMRATEERGIGE